MSAQASAWAWQQDVPSGMKFTLVAVANFADSQGVACVTQGELAELLGMGERTVRRHLADLSDLGLLDAFENRDDANFRTTNAYALRMGTPRPEAPMNEKPRVSREANLAATPKKDRVSRAAKSDSDPEPREANLAAQEKIFNSLESLTTNNINTYAEALRAVDGAGLLDVWRDWVALGRLARPTQEAQIRQWAVWVGEGRADALRAEARYIIESGSYAHPFSALKKRMAAGAGNGNGQGSEEGSGPARPALAAGQRVRYPDGTEATVVAVLSRGVATDHPDYPDVPLGQVRTLEVIS